MTLENQRLHLRIAELEAQLAERTKERDEALEEAGSRKEESFLALAGQTRVMKQRDFLLRSLRSISAFVSEQETKSWAAMDQREDEDEVNSVKAERDAARAEVERMVDGCVWASWRNSKFYGDGGDGFEYRFGNSSGWVYDKADAIAAVRKAAGLDQREEAPHA